MLRISCRQNTYRCTVTYTIVSTYVATGGCDGRKGVNTLVSQDGEEKALPGKTTVEVKPGVSKSLSQTSSMHDQVSYYNNNQLLVVYTVKLL